MPRPDDDRESAPVNDVVLRPFDAPELGQGQGGAEYASRPAVVVPTSGLLLGGEHTTVLFNDLVEAERDFDDQALIARIGETGSAHELTPLLDEALARAEAATRDGDPIRVNALLVAAVRREEELEKLGAHEARLTVGMALRRLLAIPQLRLIATLLPRIPELRDSAYLVLGRAGEEGADAVIEQLVAAESSSDRRAYFNALVHLQAGVPALMHMLGDPRWYVVRNAAELLGELDARGADEALERVMGHADERVRRAAATALGRLATPRAGQVLREALR
ncbi:MAG TPA: HEAT repeat domain-containing protein, partial [Gemmatimonadales bacterium]